jgi:hypothetical protein
MACSQLDRKKFQVCSRLDRSLAWPATPARAITAGSSQGGRVVRVLPTPIQPLRASNPHARAEIGVMWS